MLTAHQASVQIVLVYWGPSAPFELQLLARIFEQALARGAKPHVDWQWQHIPEHTTEQLPAQAHGVLAQDPAAHARADWLEHLLHRAAPTVLIGPAVAWFAQTSAAQGQRVAMHWEDAAAHEDLACRVVLSPAILETSGRWTTCAGGLAVVDWALTMLSQWAGKGVALQVMDALCLDRWRTPDARQRTAVFNMLSPLAPSLTQAIALMESNIEDPIPTDQIAQHVALSRRQLERLFKQHLGMTPSRYYLDLRLQRARKLLCETSHSLLQVALMCGFASGSHFSTTYSAVFGLAPRMERQRVLPTHCGQWPQQC